MGPDITLKVMSTYLFDVIFSVPGYVKFYSGGFPLPPKKKFYSSGHMAFDVMILTSI